MIITIIKLTQRNDTLSIGFNKDIELKIKTC